MAEDRVRRQTKIKSRRGSAGLMGRLTSHVSRTGALGIDGVIGFRRTKGFPYELSQEFGARAKPGKAMAIPVSKEAKASSGPREMGIELFIPKGTNVLAESIGKGRHARVKAHWVLVRSIAPRLRFRESVLESRRSIMREVVRAAGEVV